MAAPGRYYGMNKVRSTGPHPDPLADLMAAVERVDHYAYAIDEGLPLGAAYGIEADAEKRFQADLRTILAALQPQTKE